MVKVPCSLCCNPVDKKPVCIKEYKNHFCNSKCYGIFQRKKVTLICNFCGKEYFKIPVLKYISNFCSKQCQSEWASLYRRGKNSTVWKNNRIDKICKDCGEKFSVCLFRKNTTKFCSMKCYASWKRKQPTKEKYRRERKLTVYKNWRKTVFERDNYKCIICGEEGGELNAHHIKSWKNNLELRYDTDNGITLCVPCHKEIHKKNSELSLFVVHGKAG